MRGNSWRTWALAFSVVLSPALMQTGGTGCEPSEQLDVLELEVTQVWNPLTWYPQSFTSGISYYEVVRQCDRESCLAAPDLLVRAYASHPESPVKYTFTYLPGTTCYDELGNPVECPAPISGSLDPGGGEVFLEGALVTYCTFAELRVDVWCPPTHSGMCVAHRYTVHVIQGHVCFGR